MNDKIRPEHRQRDESAAAGDGIHEARNQSRREKQRQLPEFNHRPEGKDGECRAKDETANETLPENRHPLNSIARSM